MDSWSDDFDRKLGANLKAFRDLRGATAEKIAEKTGLSIDAIYKYEHGARKMSVRRLFEAAVALETNAETLIQNLDPRKAPDIPTAFRELRTMSKDEYAIAHRLASEWDGDVKALLYFAHLYSLIPARRRGELVVPIIMEAERMAASGEIPSEDAMPYLEYVCNAAGALLDVSKFDTKEGKQ